MKIGDKIKEQRLKKEWTQEQLAELLNVSRSAVSSWEVGRNYPDLDTIVAISDLFGISLDQLLREDKEMTKNVSKKIKMNKIYKIILGIIAVLMVGYLGYNQKLRMDESRYRRNLSENGWTNSSESNYRMDRNQYELKEWPAWISPGTCWTSSSGPGRSAAGTISPPSMPSGRSSRRSGGTIWSSAITASTGRRIWPTASGGWTGRRTRCAWRA